MYGSTPNKLLAIWNGLYRCVAYTLLLSILTGHAHAQLKVFATVPEWGALAQDLGGEKVSVFTATNALQDAHQVQARPGLLARARTTNLLIATGAELEAGWLPVLQRDAGNPNIMPGRVGMFEAAQYVQILDVPISVDRSQGHVHASGNPHIQLDPRNYIPIARALSERFILLDPVNSAYYKTRLNAFLGAWSTHLVRWEQQASVLRGMKVWVQHDAFTYLNNWLGLNQIGVLEATPGADPSITHLTAILQKQATLHGRLVMTSAYLNSKPAIWFSENAKIPVVSLPFTVGGNAEAKTLPALFDDTIRRLIQAQ
jgi:zinc/manganese transport system substrate-binding protein